MVSRIPAYLRLHTNNEEDAFRIPEGGESPEQHAFSMDVLCQKFTEVTGADLQYGPFDTLLNEVDWFMEIEDSRPGQSMAFGLKGTNDNLDGQALRQIENLAGEVGWLADRLHKTERALWEREAELAVGIPVTAHPENDEAHIAERLQSILRCGVEAVNCSAGALFLLDEATTELKVRSHWGFANGAFTEPARPLRGARADLEALTGHAIVIEKRDELNFWDIPEEFAAAVCVPVSTATMPLGTFWIYSHDARPFDDRETNVIEVVAGRIALELEREVLIGEVGTRRTASDLTSAVNWQKKTFPRETPVADGWEFAASTSESDRLVGDHCFWHSRGDGRIFSTVSSVVGDAPEIALTSAMIAGTVRGLCESRLVTDVVNGANRTLWASSDGDLLASIFASELQPTTGRIKCVASGDVGLFIVRPHGWEEIAVDPRFCGSDDMMSVDTIERQLHVDDILLAFTSPRSLTPRLLNQNVEMQQMSEIVLHHNHLTSQELIDLLRREWESDHPDGQSPPAMLVIRRTN